MDEPNYLGLHCWLATASHLASPGQSLGMLPFLSCAGSLPTCVGCFLVFVTAIGPRPLAWVKKILGCGDPNGPSMRYFLFFLPIKKLLSTNVIMPLEI